MKIVKYLNGVLRLFYPKRCPYCGCILTEKEPVCAVCRGKMPSEFAMRAFVGKNPCVAAFPYTGMFRRAVLDFKFKGRKYYGTPLAHPLASCVKTYYSEIDFDFVTAVPLHKSTERGRRFNQSRVLAEAAAGLLQVPYAELLSKTKKNRAQHTLKRREREANVKGVYNLCGQVDLKNKKVLLIDDIVTTGSTFAECSKVLCGKGCFVYCAAFCCAEQKINVY